MRRARQAPVCQLFGVRQPFGVIGSAVLLAVILLSLAAAPALAAPTCLDRNADTIRCGVPGAMPVGWKPSAQLLWDKEISRPAEQHLDQFAKVIFGLALFLAIIALMPRFDGSRGQDWDRQESDDPDEVEK